MLMPKRMKHRKVQRGRRKGFAKGGAKITLQQDGAETILTYQVNANVGGKMAQLGSRLIDGTAKKLSEQFFNKFAELAEASEVEEVAAAPAPTAVDVEPVLAETPSAPVEAQRKGLPSWLWIAGAIIAVAIVLWLIT